MKSLFISLSVFFVLLLPSFCFSAEKVTIRLRPDFPPFYFRAPSGEWKGIEVEMARVLAKEAGMEIVFKDIPWRRALVMMERGSLDMMLHLTKTEEREKFIDFVGKTVPEQMTLVVRKDNLHIKIETLDDFLKYKPFGIQKGVFYSKEFNRRVKEDPVFAEHFEAVPDTLQNALKTKSGRITGFFLDKVSTQYIIKNDIEFQELALHDFSLTDEIFLYFGLSKEALKKKPQLKEFFQAYKRLADRDVFKSILQKSFK